MKGRGITWDQATGNASDYLPYAQEYDPVYIEFMKGYAKGSGLTFEDLFTLVCRGERGFCTDVAVNGDATSDGSVYSAHTEDWTSGDQKHVVLIRGKPDKGPSFIVMSLAGLEMITGLTSAGISFSGNSLYQNDMRTGVPKMCIARRLLSAGKIGDALKAAAPANRASSYNNNICHSSGEMYCVEGSATDFALLYPHEGYLVHTNHYLDPRMIKFETIFSDPAGKSLEEGSGSVVRYHRALGIVRRNLGSVTIQTLKEILSDHVNSTSSICCHENPASPKNERYKTIYAVISDLTRLEMHVCLGNPCKGKWKVFSIRQV